MMALISSLGTLVASCDSLITSPMADSRSVLHTKICYKITGAYCAAPTCGDWDGDGDLDIIIGFLNETLLFFERSPDTVIGTCTPDEFPCNTNDACDAVSFECSCILGYEGDDCASCSGNCHSAVTDRYGATRSGSGGVFGKSLLSCIFLFESHTSQTVRRHWLISGWQR